MGKRFITATWWLFLAGSLSWTDPAASQTKVSEPVNIARPVALDGRYVVDVIGVVAGGNERGARMLGNFEITADADLDRLAGWRGATGRLHLLNNHGRTINDIAGTLQGIDNIEVADRRTKLYEAWIEQSLAGGRASLLVGLADLNASFYQNDSAGVLIAPAFGIGSELSATGPNGPSIFPSTALTARLNILIGKQAYIRAAVVNARAGVLGDEMGIDFAMRDGALLIAEAGSTRGGKLAAGIWRYSRRQDDIGAPNTAGSPHKRIPTGIYILVDQRVAGDEARGVHVFLRAGLSDGKTTSFHGGLQAGMLFRGLISGRAESSLSFGIAHARLSNGLRQVAQGVGERSAAAETGFEITYQDQLAPGLKVQPDVHFIKRAYSAGNSRNALLIGWRMIVKFNRS